MSTIQVTLLLYLTTLFVSSEEKCKDDGVCRQMKTHGMWSADCYNENFKNFPKCLRKDIEVIDLSYNRLRKITREDLSRYRNLKMLYLSDNLLTNLENSTFQDSNELFSLDLSLNGISKLPSVIFHLPSLKRLYLSQNQNMNIVEVVNETTPITSPLEAIEIGFNELEVLPNFGIMPHLWLYNISGNNLLNMKFTDIAGFCSLHKLVNDNFTAQFENLCDCWNIQKWLQQREVSFTKIDCDIRENECPFDVPEEAMAIYESCKVRNSEIKRKSTMLKISIILGCSLLVVILIITYLIYRRRKHRKSKMKKMQHFVENGKHESKGLM